MELIDTPLNKNGQFVGRNPATGSPGTKISASWLNAVQNEIVGVITGAGIQLDKTRSDQLIQAINALIDEKINDALKQTVTKEQVIALINQNAVTWE